MLAYTNKQHYDQRLVSILTLHNDHCVSQEKQGGEADVNAWRNPVKKWNSLNSFLAGKKKLLIFKSVKAEKWAAVKRIISKL